MEQSIQNITENLLSKLPGDAEYYRPSQIQDAGVPAFVVERINVELYRNLAESILPPKTDWANMQSERVEKSWNAFVEAIRAEARLPQSFAQSVFETATEDIMDMLIRPRQAIPDVLYSVDEELDMETLIERSRSVVVYRYLVKVLPRYMEKKELETLNKDRCRMVITQVDEKVTANYTPLNWAHLLNPLFELMDGDVDSELLRLFFKDKELPAVANMFDRQDGDVTVQEVIELLSSPVLETNDDQRKDDSPSESVEDERPEQREKSFSPFEDSSQKSEKFDPFKAAPQDSKTTQEVNDNKNKETDETRSEDEKDEELNKQFDVSGEDKIKADDESMAEQNEATDEDEEDIPMWKQFAEESEDEEEEPLIDLTDTEEDVEQRRREIDEHLAHNQDYFVDELFGGDEMAYSNALAELAEYKSWRKASKYVEEEIFKRNLIEIFSEPAVDFTDSLQAYFTEMENNG